MGRFGAIFPPFVLVSNRWTPGCVALILAAWLAVAQPSPDVSPRLTADGKPLDGIIGPDGKRVQVVGDGFAYDARYGQMHDFTVNIAGKYTFIVESAEAPLVAWLSNEYTPIAAAKGIPEGPFRYRLDAELVQGVKYRFAVGIGDDTRPPVRYRLGLFSGADPVFPPDPSLVGAESLPEGKTSHFTFLNEGTRWLGQPARYFTLKVSDPDRRWLRVYIRANAFAPLVHIVGPAKEDVLGRGWWAPYRKETERIAKVEGDQVGLVVFSQQWTSTNRAATLGDFVLSTNFYRRDPSRPLVEKVRDLLGDPIWSFSAGALITLVVSVYLYKRSVARRTLLYSLVSDDLVLDSEQTRSSHLKVLRGNEQVSDHVGFCSAKIRFKGHRDLVETDIHDPIRIRFERVTSILRATAEATSGWGAIRIPSETPTSVEISVKHLTSGDGLKLGVFYTQANKTRVVMHPEGRITDGFFRPDTNAFQAWRVRVGLLFAAVYFVAFPIAVIGSRSPKVPMGIFNAAGELMRVGWFVWPLGGAVWLVSSETSLAWAQRHLSHWWKRVERAGEEHVRLEAEPSIGQEKAPSGIAEQQA